MAEITNIRKKDFETIIAERGFEEQLTVKDYYITILLYLLKDAKGIYFKGGTALNKILLEHARISEDIDFTLERPLSEIRKEITKAVNTSRIFGKITQDKDVDKFVRLIVPYDTELGKGEIFLDLNERGKLLTKPEKLEIKHFYTNIPTFSTFCLSKEEIIAEKMAATIGRNKPRDHYDLYQIIKRKIPINLKLVEQKCKQSGDEFSIIKMFNQAQKLHKRWKEDLEPLIIEDVTFQEVMQTLAKHFKLIEAKDAKKDHIKN
ncbi:MAG: nucleotidyl transferase AbiEii/AbiGii toxin family protein [archaeon]